MTTDKNIEIFALIEQRKLTLEEELRDVIETRDAMNERIRLIRAQLDDLPVRKTRRAKKATGRRLLDGPPVVTLDVDESDGV